MITDDQLIAYQSGAMAEKERARFEEALAGDPTALRRLVEQEQTEAALYYLAGGNSDGVRVKQGILAVALGSSAQQLKQSVLAEIREREIPAFNLVDWITQRWLAFAAATALVLFAFAFWPSPTTPQPKVAAVLKTNVREPIDWPFAATSPWNTPIGSRAVFEEPAGIDLQLGAFIVDANATHPIHIVVPSDPIGRIFLPGNMEPFATLRIPRTALDNPNWNLTVHLIDGDEVIELGDVTASPTGDLHAKTARRANLRGSGIPPDFQAANASGLTSLAGRIRAEELKSSIRHALGAVVPATIVNGSSHVWPAGWLTQPPVMTQRFRETGNILLGSLLAIPASVDLNNLGIPTNSVAFEIARAMQDYGVYIKDVFTGEGFPEWKQVGSPHLVFCGELEWDRMPRDFQEHLARAARELKLVANNSPQSIGGGGIPRRPLAPEFSK